MQFDNAYDFLGQKFERELAPYLTYHNVTHTKAVLDAVQHLGKSENVGNYEQNLLNAAALYHDAGFLKTYQNHEAASCEIAREDLPGFGYLPEDIDAICKLIMVTKLPQAPANHLEQIICDADLYYLGSEPYFEIAARLFAEFKHTGIVKQKTSGKKNKSIFYKTIPFLLTRPWQTVTQLKRKILKR